MEHKNIEQEIETTLSSLDTVKRVEMPDYLYTKVQAKIARRNEKNKFPLMVLLTRPAISIAALFITAILNIYMIVKVQSNSNSSATKNDVSMQAFAKEYGIQSYSAYDK